MTGGTWLIYLRYGFLSNSWRFLSTDQGPEFCNSVVATFLAQNGITHLVQPASTTHSSTGEIESAVKFFRTACNKLLLSFTKSVHEILPLIQNHLNAQSLYGIAPRTCLVFNPLTYTKPSTYLSSVDLKLLVQSQD